MSQEGRGAPVIYRPTRVAAFDYCLHYLGGSGVSMEHVQHWINVGAFREYARDKRRELRFLSFLTAALNGRRYCSLYHTGDTIFIYFHPLVAFTVKPMCEANSFLTSRGDPGSWTRHQVLQMLYSATMSWSVPGKRTDRTLVEPALEADDTLMQVFLQKAFVLMIPPLSSLFDST